MPSLSQVFNIEPIPGYYFRLFFIQSQQSLGELHCFEVSGLEQSLELDKGPGKPPNLVNKLQYKELVVKKALMNYANALENGFISFMEKCLNDPTTPSFSLILMAINNVGAAVRSWLFSNAFPIKFSTTGFNSSKSEILYDEITFQYEKFEVLDAPVAVGGLPQMAAKT